jgi:hypothetical protein
MTLTQSSHLQRGQDQQMAAPAPTPTAAPAAKSKPKLGRPFAKGGAQGGATGLRGKCWWLMRELGTFTINRLLETYATGTEKDAHNNVAHYLGHLEAVGVVERLDRRQPGEALTSPGYVVWRLTRNLGLLAPVWRREQKVLWDPNRCEIVSPLAAAPQEQASSVTSETGFEND